jgi:exonuclease III
MSLAFLRSKALRWPCSILPVCQSIYGRDQYSTCLKNINILALNETRLDHSISDDLVTIPNYDIIHNDSNRNGSGVCIYVRNSINYRNLSHTIPDDLDAVVIEIHKPISCPFIVSTIYRPLNSSVDIFAKIEHFISNFDCEQNELYLLGDLNCNILDASSHVTKKLNLLNMESYNFIK